jgi:hypothetical protein
MNLRPLSIAPSSGNMVRPLRNFEPQRKPRRQGRRIWYARSIEGSDKKRQLRCRTPKLAPVPGQSIHLSINTVFPDGRHYRLQIFQFGIVCNAAGSQNVSAVLSASFDKFPAGGFNIRGSAGHHKR